MTLYNQIQELIVKCIDGSIDVKTFREQFVQLFFSINRKFDIDAVALADSVDNLYGDVLIGEISEDQFRQKLIQLTPVVVTEFLSTRLEWAFEATTSTPPAEEVGPPNQKPETRSEDVQFLRLAACV